MKGKYIQDNQDIKKIKDGFETMSLLVVISLSNQKLVQKTAYATI